MDESAHFEVLSADITSDVVLKWSFEGGSRGLETRRAVNFLILGSWPKTRKVTTGAIITPRYECVQLTVGSRITTRWRIAGIDHRSPNCVSWRRILLPTIGRW